MTLGRPQTLMMSGAWPPPAPSVWKAWMVRPLIARDGVLDEAASRSACRCGSSPARRSRRRPTGSSRWPPASCPSPRAASASRRRPGPSPPARPAARRCPCRTGRCSSGRRRRPGSCAPMCQGPGVQVVASVPCAGPVPPPSMVVTPRHQRFLDLLRADEVDMRVEAAGGEDLALAGDDLGAGADDDGDAGLGVRIAGLADGGDAAVLQADIGLVDAGRGRRSAHW